MALPTFLVRARNLPRVAHYRRRPALGEESKNVRTRSRRIPYRPFCNRYLTAVKTDAVKYLVALFVLFAAIVAPFSAASAQSFFVNTVVPLSSDELIKLTPSVSSYGLRPRVGLQPALQCDLVAT